MAETPNTNKDLNLKDLEIIELKVEINKDLPATPGDKEVSRVFTVKSEEPPDAIELWPKTTSPQEWQFKSRKDSAKGGGKMIRTKLLEWDGKEAITIAKPHVNDIVPSADLSDPPQWQVKVNICDDKLPQAPLPPKDQNPPQAPTRVRVNVFLSFDTERYTIFPYGKWPEDVNQRKDDTKKGLHKSKDVNQGKADIKERIYQAISGDDKEIIKYFILKRYIQTSRLPLDEIREGEWFLPIFIGKSGSKEKQFLAYVRVVIEWKPNGPKPTDTPAKQEAKEPAASVDKPEQQKPESKEKHE